MDAPVSFIAPVCALVLAPLLLGLINRTKAFVAGRRGPPLLQPYFDIAKCLRRSAVYGDTTSWVFRLGPVVNLAVLLAGLLIVPLGGISPPLSFSGDLVVLAGLFALGRFATVLAALDTGSSFEGMGAQPRVAFCGARPNRRCCLALADPRPGHRRDVADADLRGSDPGIWTAALPASRWSR